MGVPSNWTAAILATIFEVLIVGYLFYGLDLFFDIDLVKYSGLGPSAETRMPN